MSFLFRPSVVALVELLLKLAFRLEPIVQVTTVNSATLDVNLNPSLTNLYQTSPIVAPYIRRRVHLVDQSRGSRNPNALSIAGLRCLIAADTIRVSSFCK